jgi:hypothetical protein
VTTVEKQVEEVTDVLNTIADMDLELSNKELTKLLIKLAPTLLAFEARILALEKKLIKDTPN